jgi:hypothetical protein
MVVNLLPSRYLASTQLPSRPEFAGDGAAQVDSLLAYAQQITVGAPGRCSKRPVLYIGSYDSSPSVSATGGSDSQGQRFLEADLAITRVGVRCRCGADLVATVHFDETSYDLPPTPIRSSNRAAITGSLRVPPDAAGMSVLGRSLKVTRKLIAQYPDHQAVFVVHTDFELFDNYMADLLSLSADVHAVVLRARPPQELLDAPNVTVTRVDHTSPAGTVARAVFAALTTGRLGAAPIAPDSAGRADD